MDASAATHLIPPHPTPPAHELGFRAFLRATRTNALTMWTERAYQEDILERDLLGRRTLLLNSPDAIHRVLVDNHANYRRSPASIRILRPIAGDGLLLSEGDAWRHQRRTIAPALAPRVMPLLARHVVSTAQEQLIAIAEQSREQPIDLLATMQFLTLEIAGRSMFSLEMRSHGAALRRMLGEYALRLSQPHMLDLLLPPAIPTFRDLRRHLFKRRWMRLIEVIMEPRLAAPAPETARDLFDLLRAARDPETGEAFSRDHLRDQLATLLLAGHETTAVTLFWTLTLLALDAEAQEQVAAEVRDVAIEPDNATTVLPRLVRTRAVLSEGLRLYPPAFVIVRQAIGPDRLANVDVAPGTILMIAPWVLHRHHRLWRDPDAFDPSRFMPDASQPPRFSYMPFGAGPRICVGAQFALTEAALVLAMLLQRFRITLDDTPPMPVAVVTTQPDHPAKFRLQPR